MAYALAYVNAFDRAKGGSGHCLAQLGGFRRVPPFAERTHRLENPGKFLLELVEIQTGSYLGKRVRLMGGGAAGAPGRN